MRLIGYLPNQTSAIRFSSYLYGSGISNMVESESDGYAVWVHSEDCLETAQNHFQRFLGNPQDPAFRVTAIIHPVSTAPQPAATPEQTIEEITAFVKAHRRYGPGPLSLALILGCMVLSLLSHFGENREWLGPLFITAFEIEGEYVKWQSGLPEVVAGEIWRLITPILIHAGFIPLFVNSLWLLGLGSMVEARQSTGRLMALILIFGVLSNLGQYLLAGPNFGGIFGVAYGLLGYIWMKGRFQPSQGLRLNLNTVTLMMIWLFVCLLDIVPGAANGANLVGLLAGFVMGYLSTRPGLAPA